VTQRQRTFIPLMGGFGREVGIFPDFDDYIKDFCIPTLLPAACGGREVGITAPGWHPDIPIPGACRDGGSVCNLAM
jgi:hypothetical protein